MKINTYDYSKTATRIDPCAGFSFKRFLNISNRRCFFRYIEYPHGFRFSTCILYQLNIRLSLHSISFARFARFLLKSYDIYQDVQSFAERKPHTPYGRVRLARFTLEDHAYGASRLPKTTVLQSRHKFLQETT